MFICIIGKKSIPKFYVEEGGYCPQLGQIEEWGAGAEIRAITMPMHVKILYI